MIFNSIKIKNWLGARLNKYLLIPRRIQMIMKVWKKLMAKKIVVIILLFY